MELLAPVGCTENFVAAVEAGADAVYVGAPGVNARNIRSELSLEEISGMSRYCKKNGLRLYFAANSLILERELPYLVKLLAQIETLEPDGLIVQDIGLLRIIKKYFPSLPIHASTLMAAHNLDSVRALQKLGCERVVMAREMTLAEIESIAQKSTVELEVFVHGAMCYSYSGLCLFSSYFGGKSGLRGNCVQPCRRAYSYQDTRKGRRDNRGQGKRQKEYLFSMNDLDGMEVIDDLRKAGIASLKIEGRLRSAHYISSVVKAYRKVLDADENSLQGAMEEARELVEGSMSRKVTSGYFYSSRPETIITPQRSGNMGLFLGKMELYKQLPDRVVYSVKLKETLAVGDRVRIHDTRSGERHAVTIHEMQIANNKVERAKVDDLVRLVFPKSKISAHFKFGELYKVDLKGRSGEDSPVIQELGRLTDKRKLAAVLKQQGKFIQRTTNAIWLEKNKQDSSKEQKARNGWKKGKGSFRKKRTPQKPPLEIWLRTDSLKTVLSRWPFNPDRVVLNVTEQLVGQAGLVKRALGARSKKTIWALPPVIHEQDMFKVKKQVKTLVRNGYRSFQLGHIGQALLFAHEKVHLFGDYTLNLLNSQAIKMAAELGLEAGQISVECDRDSMEEMIFGYKKIGIPTPKGGNPSVTMKVGVTVYGRPALYTSRLHAKHFQLGKTVVSPKNEAFVIQKKDNLIRTYADKPFSLLPYQRQMKMAGVDYGVIDVTGSHVGKKELLDINERLMDSGKYSKLSTFNYLGELV